MKKAKLATSENTENSKLGVFLTVHHEMTIH